MPRIEPPGREPADPAQAGQDAFESLLADVVARLTAPPVVGPSDGVEGVLAPIARFFGADQVYLAKRMPDASGWDRAHVWTEYGASTGAGRTEAGASAEPSWTDRRLLAGEAVLANSLSDLPAAAAADRARYEAMGLRSVLDVPLRGRGGAVGGCVGLRRHARTAEWTEVDAVRLRLLGEVTAGLLAGYGAAPAADAAELHRISDALRRVEERLFAALETAGIGVYDWDVASGRVWYVSPFYMQRTSARDSHETHADQWFQATHPDDAPAARAEVQRAVSGVADRFSTTVRMQIPYYDSEWIYVRSQGHVLGRDAAGRALRVIGIYQNVTEEVRRAAVEREREVALEHAMRMASLGTLATSLAHELNQPLAALTGFVHASQRLLDEGETRRADVKEALRRSAEVAEKASEIVRRLRRLVQHAPPLLERLDLQVIMRTTIELLARDARAAHVELRVLPGRPPADVLGDRIQLEQVLVNLVRNAIEGFATRDGGPRYVTLEALHAGDRLELRVSDTGPGVRADARDRLFEPFFTTKAGGTGLGLTISRSIVEAHGGAIRLERTGPDGSCFVVSLPVAAQDTHGAR